MAGFVSSGRAPIWSNMFSWLSPLVIGIKGTASGLNGSGDVRMGGVNTCELTPLSFKAQNTGVAIKNYNCVCECFVIMIPENIFTIVKSS